jgi:hypothetical protein
MGLAFTFGDGAKLMALESTKSWTTCLKALQFSTLCPGAPEWNSHLAFSSKLAGLWSGLNGANVLSWTNPKSFNFFSKNE